MPLRCNSAPQRLCLGCTGMRLRRSGAPATDLRTFFRAFFLSALLFSQPVLGSWGGDWARSRESQSVGPAAHSRDHRRHRQVLYRASSCYGTSSYYCSFKCCLAPFGNSVILMLLYTKSSPGSLSHRVRLFCSQHFTYTKDDLLIAIPGQTERLSLVEASRPWRQGVKTFVALEKPLKEPEAPKGFLVGQVPSTDILPLQSC